MCRSCHIELVDMTNTWGHGMYCLKCISKADEMFESAKDGRIFMREIQEQYEEEKRRRG